MVVAGSVEVVKVVEVVEGCMVAARAVKTVE